MELLFYGGFGVTFLCLLRATFSRTSRLGRRVLYVFSFLGLLYQVGCWGAAIKVGAATGGGTDEAGRKLSGILLLSFLIVIVWAALIQRFKPYTEGPDDMDNTSGHK
jgi:hypothetical protein